ncbi:MAG: hypothetical protein WEA31_09695 [Pirellulales bacterium]
MVCQTVGTGGNEEYGEFLPLSSLFPSVQNTDHIQFIATLKALDIGCCFAGINCFAGIALLELWNSSGNL